MPTYLWANALIRGWIPSQLTWLEQSSLASMSMRLVSSASMFETSLSVVGQYLTKLETVA